MKISKVTNVGQQDLDKTFDIIQNNMQKLDWTVNENDKMLWQDSFKNMLMKQNFSVYFVFKKDELCAFFELEQLGNELILHEIQLNDNVKHTFVLLNILQFLLSNKDFEKYKTIKFSILKNNDMSNKTFTHLGGEKVKETENKFYYLLTREKAEKFLTKFERYQIKN